MLEFCFAALIHCFCAAYRFIGHILNRQSERKGQYYGLKCSDIEMSFAKLRERQEIALRVVGECAIIRYLNNGKLQFSL